MITVLVILSTFLYRGNKIPLLALQAIGVFLSYFFSGRSSFGILLILFMYTTFSLIHKNNKVLSTMIFVLCILILALNVEHIINSDIYRLTSFYSEGIDSPRFWIWKQYFSEFNLVDLVYFVTR